MGAGKALSADVLRNLIPGLRSQPTAHVFIATHRAGPAGIATCFRGFSTFAARPQLNISDYFVVPSLRGFGIAKRLMQAVESRALDLGC